MNVRRSLLTVLFALIASLLAAVSCGPVNGGKAEVKTSATDFTKAIEECKDTIRRYDAHVEDKIVMCGVTDSKVAESYTENLVHKATDAAPTAVAPNTSVTSVEAPPADSVMTKKSVLSYEPMTIPLRYAINKKDSQLQVALKIGVSFPKDTPKLTSDWSLFVLNSCREQIQSVWKSSSLDVLLDLPKIEIVSNVVTAQSYDQVLNLAGPADLNPNAYPALVVQNWPDRARLLPRASEDALAQCAGVEREKQKCQAQKILAANAAFCQDFSLLVGTWLGLNRKATADKTACASGAVPISDADSGTFMKAADGSGDDTSKRSNKRSAFSKKDLRRILAPACKSAGLNAGL